MTRRNIFSDDIDPGELAPGDRYAGNGIINMVSPGQEMFDLLDTAEWHEATPPEREWMLEGWLPRRRAAYITGAGGAGKSLLGQQLATCIAAGRPFLGMDTAQANAIYLTAEDDYDELQRRQRCICRSLGISEAEVSMKLFPLSLFGRASNEMVDFDRERGMRTLPAWQMLKNTARVTLAKFIVLDNVSHIFAGNEIDRAQVTAFANLLNGLAHEIGGTVLLIGHPNKQGDAYSGSTAWENAFRARLYFDAPKGDSAQTDPDLRQLSLPKANYARKGAAIDVRWFDGALICDEDLPPSIAEQLRQVSAHTAANEAFLRCLDAALKQRRAVSHVSGVNYAPKIFSEMPEGKGFDVDDFRGAMNRLVHLGEIAFEQRLWKGENYHWKVGIKRGDGVRQPSANPSDGDRQKPQKSAKNDPLTPIRQPSANPSAEEGVNPQKTVRQPSANHPPANPSPLKGGMGGPQEEGPPIPDDPLGGW